MDLTDGPILRPEKPQKASVVGAHAAQAQCSGSHPGNASHLLLICRTFFLAPVNLRELTGEEYVDGVSVGLFIA